MCKAASLNVCESVGESIGDSVYESIYAGICESNGGYSSIRFLS
jgi:hypothetical protein